MTIAGASFGFAAAAGAAASRAKTLRPRRRLRRFLDLGFSCSAASAACPLPDRFSAARPGAWSANGLVPMCGVESRDAPAPGARAPVLGSSTCVFLLAPREPERTLHALIFRCVYSSRAVRNHQAPDFTKQLTRS